MSNWCIGELKVRGSLVNIEEFLDKNLIAIGGSYFEQTEREPEKTKETYWIDYNLREGERCFYLNGTRRHFIEGSIEICFDEKDEIVTCNLGDLRAAWGLDTDVLAEYSKKYNVDLKIYAYERGMEFNIDFEVHKGKVIKNNEIKFDDYIWECTNPSIGG